MQTRYDYIIAGAGSAGCVLARRLADAGYQVLLLEAGGSDKSWIIQMPAGLRSVFKPTSKFNWWFYTEPQKHLNNRKVQQPRGKVLGGSSSINGMTWLRGHPMDYDRWQQEGAEGWDWASCLPYFKKIENSSLNSHYRGQDGPIGVQRQEQLSALNAAFLKAGQQAGWPLTDDVNGYQQEGVSRFEMSVKNGIRNSTAFGYLHNRKKSDSLTIWTGCQILKINLQGSTASGCQVKYKSQILDVIADRETLLCAGVYGSPQLLMLSGIGPSQHLEEHDIDCKIDVPGVGENLQDHLECHIHGLEPNKALQR
jgi:choline dehydrogenase